MAASSEFCDGFLICCCLKRLYKGSSFSKQWKKAALENSSAESLKMKLQGQKQSRGLHMCDEAQDHCD